jgi:hypothetical protein
MLEAAMGTRTGAHLEGRDGNGVGIRRVCVNLNLPIELSSFLFINIVA